MIRKTFIVRLFLLVFLAFSIAASSGCSPAYDETTYKAVSSLNKDVNDFFTKMDRCLGTPEAEYANNIAFYDKTNTTLNSLSMRVAAIPHNDTIIDQINYLKETVQKMRNNHELQGNLSLLQLKWAKGSFDNIFKDTIKYMDELKRKNR